MAVKEQRPAVKRMKKGSSFFGYTETSWKAVLKMRGKQTNKQIKRQRCEQGWAVNNETIIISYLSNWN